MVLMEQLEGGAGQAELVRVQDSGRESSIKNKKILPRVLEQLQRLPGSKLIFTQLNAQISAHGLPGWRDPESLPGIPQFCATKETRGDFFFFCDVKQQRHKLPEWLLKKYSCNTAFCSLLSSYRVCVCVGLC